MKIKRLYLLGIGLMFTSQFLTSCHDLLEKDPTDSYSETVAWSSESSLDMYVTYLYKPLNGLSNFSSLSLTDGYTDLVKYGNGVPQTWSAHNKILLQQNTITSDNNPMSSWGLYTDIFRENVFLRDAGIYGSKFNEDFLNTRIAEIRFIRAVNYARMIRIFGGVILRDETNGVDSEGEKAKARATEAESWDFVLKDLEFAAKHLPKEWDSKWDGRLTKGAAYAYMCRTALFAKRWDIAITAADEIKKLNKYDLMDEYKDVFKVAGNKEIIFSIAYKIPDMPHYFDRYFAPDGKQGIRRAVPTSELVDSYDMADGTPFSWSGSMAKDPYVGREPRFYLTVMWNRQWYHQAGREVQMMSNEQDGGPTHDAPQNGYLNRKKVSLEQNNRNGIHPYRPGILYRLGEAYLNYAEALNECDPGNPDILKYLNLIRERAGMPQYGTGKDSNGFDKIPLNGQDEVREAIYHERRVELCCENGLRYLDLRRWKKAEEVLNQPMYGMNFSGTKLSDDPNDDAAFFKRTQYIKRVYERKFYWYPIYQEQIDKDPTLVQAPFWDK